MLISIVMPVYNSTKQLRHSVASVQEQTDENWELIIVNDGSTDNTPAICEEYAAQDQRIKVFHIQNHGPADARNVGLYYAAGEYIIFLDSDDLLAPHAIKKLRELIQVKEFEIVFYGYRQEFYDGEQKIKFDEHRLEAQTFNSNENFKTSYDELDAAGMTHPVWNKMFQTSFLRAYLILFPSGLFISEDFVFNLTAYSFANKVFISPEVLYHYVSRKRGSITTSFRKSKIKDIEKVYEKTYRLMKAWQPKHLNKINNEFIGNISVYINSLYKKDCLLSVEEKRAILTDIFQNENVARCVREIEPLGYRNKIMKVLLENEQMYLLKLTGRLANNLYLQQMLSR